MSASGAAPLPRLGEVFFDVRGSSRSMRLSWYSDTGVAVFSIWQGGTCTGTFRLPVEDLSRMVESLQRGPRGGGLPAADTTGATSLPGLGTGAGGTGGHPALGGDAPATSFPDYATGQHMAAVTGEFRRPDLGERDGDRSRAGDPLGSGGYRPPAPPAPSYREDPLTSPGFRAEARSGSYRDSGERPYGGDPLGSGGYRPPAYPAPPSYRDDPLSSPAYAEPRSGSYRDSGERPYGGYRPPAYGYSPAQDSYPPAYRDAGAGGYPADEPGGYRGRRYADDPFQSNYPDEAPGGSHPYGAPEPHGPEPRGRRGRPSRT